MNHEENTLVRTGSGSDPRGSTRNLSSPCERAETSVSSVGLRDEVDKHEPGPWKVSLVDGYLMVHAPDHESDKYIAEVANEADARLIAAAPELLEALKNIENDAGTIPEPIWKMVKEAIAKAVGR